MRRLIIHPGLPEVSNGFIFFDIYGLKEEFNGGGMLNKFSSADVRIKNTELEKGNRPFAGVLTESHQKDLFRAGETPEGVYSFQLGDGF